MTDMDKLATGNWSRQEQDCHGGSYVSSALGAAVLDQRQILQHQRKRCDASRIYDHPDDADSLGICSEELKLTDGDAVCPSNRGNQGKECK